MTKMVFLIRLLSANPETKQDNSVSKEVGNGVDCVRYEGLALAKYACYKFT
jgi:hypothetical protein